MDLRVSALLLFMLLSGGAKSAGYALKCYSCTGLTGICEKVETCPKDGTKCATMALGPVISKSCAPDECQNVNQKYTSIQCCATDLCNSADGMYKGSVLLLFSPLLFYFLFQ